MQLSDDIKFNLLLGALCLGVVIVLTVVRYQDAKQEENCKVDKRTVCVDNGKESKCYDAVMTDGNCDDED